jgi:surface-adhesin protein E
MWSLYDHKTAQGLLGSSFLSLMMQRAYDCTGERSQILALIYFSDNMGKGKPVYNDSEEGMWVPVAPRSVDQRRWKIACAKK